MIIASEHHNWRKIPIQIEWNEVESEHFTVYARSGDESIAKQVIDLLEKNYGDIFAWTYCLVGILAQM